MQTLATLQEDLLARAITPIFDLLKEIKLLARTNQEQRNLAAITKTITNIDTQVKRSMEKPPPKPRVFQP